MIRKDNLIKWDKQWLWNPTDLGWKFDFPTYYLCFIIFFSLPLSLPSLLIILKLCLIDCSVQSSLSSALLKSGGNGVEVSVWTPEWTRLLGILEGALFFLFWSRLQVGLPADLVLKNLPADARDVGLTPGLKRSPGGGNGNSLQYSWLENPHGQRILIMVSQKSWTWLSSSVKQQSYRCLPCKN